MGRIESEITSVSLHPMKINSFDEPVTLTLKNTQVGIFAQKHQGKIIAFVSFCSLKYFFPFVHLWLVMFLSRRIATKVKPAVFFGICLGMLSENC